MNPYFTAPQLPENQLGPDAFERLVWAEFVHHEIDRHAYAKHISKWLGEFEDLGPRIFGQPEKFIEWSRECLTDKYGDPITETLAQVLGTGLQLDWEAHRDRRIDENQKR